MLPLHQSPKMPDFAGILGCLQGVGPEHVPDYMAVAAAATSNICRTHLS